MVRPDEIPTERADMLRTAFGDYEDSLRGDRNRIFADANFDSTGT